VSSPAYDVYQKLYAYTNGARGFRAGFRAAIDRADGREAPGRAKNFLAKKWQKRRIEGALRKWPQKSK